jgi:hypothetical protein
VIRSPDEQERISTTHTVTISTTTAGASIRYTTDGSTPIETAGTLYPGAVTVNSTATLNAIAYESGYMDSPVASATCTIYSLIFHVAVTVSQLTSTSFTFTTLPGHVLYPATISFTASSPGAGLLSFTINVNGTFANKEAAEGYRAAGSAIEDNIWNNVLAQVKNDCTH